MPNDAAKVIDIAEKITAKAEGALHGLEREMIVMKWPPEFRTILWEAVAAIATQRADSCRAVGGPTK
jgi:hypothetical protein